MATTTTVTGTAVAKRMTLDELRVFVRDCDEHGMPGDSVPEVRTGGFSPIGLRTITVTGRGPTG
jgi:hypothetical protein